MWSGHASPLARAVDDVFELALSRRCGKIHLYLVERELKWLVACFSVRGRMVSGSMRLQKSSILAILPKLSNCRWRKAK